MFADDSDDGTPEAIEEQEARYTIRVACIHRPVLSRSGGLTGAVVEGIRQSSATWICVIDGDLQHPPEAIPDLYARVREGSEVDLIIGSRNLEGGKQALTGVRKLVSQSTGFLAKVLFPASLKAVTDPMSGFFLMHRQSIPMDDLRPNGFKLLLEILVRGRNLRVLEVPYHFQTRENGKSKFGVHEGPRFAALIWALRGRAVSSFGSLLLSGRTDWLFRQYWLDVAY